MIFDITKTTKHTVMQNDKTTALPICKLRELQKNYIKEVVSKFSSQSPVTFQAGYGIYTQQKKKDTYRPKCNVIENIYKLINSIKGLNVQYKQKKQSVNMNIT